MGPAARHKNRGLLRSHRSITPSRRKGSWRPARRRSGGYRVFPAGKRTVLARTPTPDVARAHAPIAALMLGVRSSAGCDLDHRRIAQWPHHQRAPTARRAGRTPCEPSHCLSPLHASSIRRPHLSKLADRRAARRAPHRPAEEPSYKGCQAHADQKRRQGERRGIVNPATVDVANGSDTAVLTVRSGARWRPIGRAAGFRNESAIASRPFAPRAWLGPISKRLTATIRLGLPRSLATLVR